MESFEQAIAHSHPASRLCGVLRQLCLHEVLRASGCIESFEQTVARGRMLENVSVESVENDILEPLMLVSCSSAHLHVQ